MFVRETVLDKLDKEICSWEKMCIETGMTKKKKT